MIWKPIRYLIMKLRWRKYKGYLVHKSWTNREVDEYMEKLKKCKLGGIIPIKNMNIPKQGKEIKNV